MEMLIDNDLYIRLCGHPRSHYIPRLNAPPFVPPREDIALLHKDRKAVVTESCSIKELIYHMELSSYNLDIYLMALQPPAILNSIIYLHTVENIGVRVIMDEAFKSKLKRAADRLIAAGISVRWKPAHISYRYKVCLVDCHEGLDDPMFNTIPVCLMTDSINNVKVVENTENAVVITGKMTIMQFQRQFNCLWARIKEFQ